MTESLREPLFQSSCSRDVSDYKGQHQRHFPAILPLHQTAIIHRARTILLLSLSTMTIIHRNNLSSDYADLLCTTSTKQSHTPQISSPLRKSWLSQQTLALRRVSAQWTEAICPPVSEVKVVVERLYSDPDMSMTNIFKVLAPVWVFGCVLMLGARLSEQQHTRMLEQKAASAMGDITLPDIEWGLITKPFLWWTFGGLLVIYITLTIMSNMIGRLVGPEVTANKAENARWQPSGSRFSSAWELDAVDIYSAMWQTV
jgi:hypothetical protein